MKKYFTRHMMFLLTVQVLAIMCMVLAGIRYHYSDAVYLGGINIMAAILVYKEFTSIKKKHVAREMHVIAQVSQMFAEQRK